MPKQSACRSCGAAIYWTKTAKGKAMPVDVKPDKQGRLVLYSTDSGIQSRHEDDAPKYAVRSCQDRRYISHFATCPDAKEHRGASRARPQLG